MAGANTLTLDKAPSFNPDAPETKAAIEAEVAKRLAEKEGETSRVDAILTELMAKMAALGLGQVGQQAPDQGVLSALALQLAEITGQGTGRIYVAPEVVQKRRMAFERLKETLLRLHAERRVPAYRLRNKVQLDFGPRTGHVLVEPLWRNESTRVVEPVEIDWRGIPNQAMFPINEAAEEVYAHFSDWIGAGQARAEPDELMALRQDGVVVRGAAAAQIARSDRRSMGRHGMDDAGDDFIDPEQPIGAIRKNGPTVKNKVQVLGTLTAPVEVS